jgi:2-phospho-L-lactate guanylyltransferase
LAIIPANAPAAAKRRLEPLLAPDGRAELVRAMLADVVAACKRARLVESVQIVTPDPALAPRGTDVVVDPGRGHAAAIATALASCRARGAVVVMADCPLVRPETIDALCEAARPVALCPAQDGGTNALALRPPDALEPAFGLPGGAALTVARARAAGFEAVVIDDPLVALDVDHPDDVQRVLDLGAGTHTRALLDAVLGCAAGSSARAR